MTVFSLHKMLELAFFKNNHGNQGYNGNQTNVNQGQRPDMENTYYNPLT